MTRFRYYVATTLDGFIADAHDSLDWLLTQPIDDDGAFNYGNFITDIGALVMGATTYQWVLDHNAETGESWSYTQPTWVFTHRDLTPVSDDVRMVAGNVGDFRQALVEAAAGNDVWIVGGGGLAAEFARVGMLDEVIVSIAPVLLGSGRPLFGGDAFNLELRDFDRNKAFLCARYDVVGAR